jgi:hypothetical protein
MKLSHILFLSLSSLSAAVAAPNPLPADTASCEQSSASLREGLKSLSPVLQNAVNQAQTIDKNEIDQTQRANINDFIGAAARVTPLITKAAQLPEDRFRSHAAELCSQKDGPTLLQNDEIDVEAITNGLLDLLDLAGELVTVILGQADLTAILRIELRKLRTELRKLHDELRVELRKLHGEIRESLVALRPAEKIRDSLDFAGKLVSTVLGQADLMAFLLIEPRKLRNETSG